MHSGLARGEHHDTWIVLYSNARVSVLFCDCFPGTIPFSAKTVRIICASLIHVVRRLKAFNL